METLKADQTPTIEVVREFRELNASLEGFSETQSLSEYFQRLRELKSKVGAFFEDGSIFNESGLMLGLNVIVRQGKDEAEASSYHQGNVWVEERDEGGVLKAIGLDSTSKLIPFHPKITT